MVDLSLRILDLLEHSLRAGASVISVSVHEKRKEDRLEVTIEDNGTSASATPSTAPDHGTDKGKSLGIGQFKATAEQAGGSLQQGKSPLGGALVKATMQLSHADRVPLGDLASMLSSVVCTNPEVDLWFTVRVDAQEACVKVSEVATEVEPSDRCGLAVARRVSERIKACVEKTGVVG